MTQHTESADFLARVAGLRVQLTGPAFLPGEDGYAEETSTYNLITPLRPRVVVAAASVADVQAAIRFAAENHLGVAVRGGGHIVAKQDQGIIVVNMRQMRTVYVDPAKRLVRFEGGALWQEVLDAVTLYRLAPLNGSTPTVGAMPTAKAGGSAWS